MLCLRTEANRTGGATGAGVGITPPCNTGVEITDPCFQGSEGRWLDRPVHWSEVYGPGAAAESEPVSPPSINIGVHWLRGTIPHADIQRLADWLVPWLGVEERYETGLWVYDRSMRWPGGVVLNYMSEAARYRYTDGQACLEIPGAVLARWDMVTVALFCRQLVEHFPAWRTTRVDVYFDDLERVIVPHELYETIYAEDWSADPVLVGSGRDRRLVRRPTRQDFSGFRTIAYQSKHRADEGCQYDCVTFGQRGKAGSGKYLRVYDKWLESAGEIPAVRWELELTDERARKLFARLLAAPTDEWAQCIGTLITTCIDFPVRNAPMSERRNLNRLPRHTFWTDILDRVGTADKNALALADTPKTVARSLGYVEHQAVGSLQMLRLAVGRKAFLMYLLDRVDDDDRLTRKHRDAVAEFRRYLAGSPDEPSVVAVMDFFGSRGLEFDPDLASTGGVDGVSELQRTGEIGRGGAAL